MEHGIRSKLAFTLTGILLGCIIGTVATFSIKRTSKQTIENPRIMKFGDITISAFVPIDANDTYVEELTLYKNDRKFLWTYRNSLDEVHNLNLVGSSGDIIFSLDASKEPGKWRVASYGLFEPKCEHYFDINFDGQFDVKALFDKNDEVLSRYIYYEGVWKRAENSQEHQNKAVSGSETFTFHEDSGWQLDNISNTESNQLNGNN